MTSWSKERAESQRRFESILSRCIIDVLDQVQDLKAKYSSVAKERDDLLETVMKQSREIKQHDVDVIKERADRDISYNPALGTGQIQIRDIHYVEKVNRNVWEFCQLLDGKFIQSKKGFKNGGKASERSDCWPQPSVWFPFHGRHQSYYKRKIFSQRHRVRHHPHKYLK